MPPLDAIVKKPPRSHTKDILGQSHIALLMVAMTVMSDFYNRTLIIWQYQTRLIGPCVAGDHAASHAR
jgi:hypothetical protein